MHKRTLVAFGALQCSHKLFTLIDMRPITFGTQWTKSIACKSQANLGLLAKVHMRVRAILTAAATFGKVCAQWHFLGTDCMGEQAVGLIASASQESRT